MTSAGVQYAIANILEDEGGVLDVGDGKGITRYGQTPRWLAANDLVPPSNSADAASNYEVWMTKFKFDHVCSIDPFVGWMLADFAVHSGEFAAIKTFQRALGVQDDGKLGPQTLGRFQAVAGSPILARKFVSQRMRFIGTLLASETIDRRKWARGWMNRLADHVEKLP